MCVCVCVCVYFGVYVCVCLSAYVGVCVFSICLYVLVCDQIDALKIHCAALKIKGASGPSCLDAASWCTSHHGASNDL